jgi:Ca2+-binding EF-hand superfamily protein
MATNKPELTGVRAVDRGQNFDFKEMLSSRPLLEQYRNLEPKFRKVFEKYDTKEKGYLDKDTFPALCAPLTEGLMGKDIKAYEERIQNSKDCFHQPMRSTQISWENINKDSDDHVTWDEFWTFLTNDRMLARIEKEGLRWVFLAFHMWDVPSYQEEFIGMKPRFIQVFKKYDTNGTGCLDSETFAEVCSRILHIRPDLVDRVQAMDEQRDDKITWGEFWKFFSTGEMFPTNEEEFEQAKALLGVLEADNHPADAAEDFAQGAADEAGVVEEGGDAEDTEEDE